MIEAQELKTLLSKFNRGVRAVTLECGVFSIQVSSAKAALGVTIDLLRSRAFKSVVTQTNNGKIFVYAAV